MIGLLRVYNCARRPSAPPASVLAKDSRSTSASVGATSPQSLVRQVGPPKSPRFSELGGMRTLSFRMQDEVTMEICLERPAALRLPGRPEGAPTLLIIRAWTDDSKRYLTAVDRPSDLWWARGSHTGRKISSAQQKIAQRTEVVIP